MDGNIFCMSYDDMVIFIKARMNELGMNQSDLAQKSELSASQISRILKLESTPSQDAIAAISRALHLPAETLFRKAGLLPSISEMDELKAAILDEAKDMTEQEKRSLLAFIRSTKQMRTPASKQGSMPASKLSKVKK
jgi:transcriptional regulator with XRE-family HTH domain